MGVAVTRERLVTPATRDEGLPHMYISEVKRVDPGRPYNEHSKMIVIAVRGSACYADWGRNARCSKKSSNVLRDTPLSCLKFHSGFLDAAEQLLPKAQAALEAAAQGRLGQLSVTVTGHSLGDLPPQP